MNDFMEYDHIYRQAALALSQMRAPSFDYDDDDLLDAFGYGALISEYQEWYAYFRHLIQSCNCDVDLVEHAFYTGIKGLNRTYLLTKSGVEKRVVIVTGVPYIQIV